MENKLNASERQLEILKIQIRALWALIMGHFVGDLRPTCTCCDTLGPEDDDKREKILDIFRKMGFEDTIELATKDYFSVIGRHYGWPYKTLPLTEHSLLVRLLEAAPRVLNPQYEKDVKWFETGL